MSVKIRGWLVEFGSLRSPCGLAYVASSFALWDILPAHSATCLLFLLTFLSFRVRGLLWRPGCPGTPCVAHAVPSPAAVFLPQLLRARIIGGSQWAWLFPVYKKLNVLILCVYSVYTFMSVRCVHLCPCLQRPWEGTGRCVPLAVCAISQDRALTQSGPSEFWGRLDAGKPQRPSWSSLPSSFAGITGICYYAHLFLFV